MDSNAFKMILQNIEEYVMDEDKIVTYKWLSKNFDIHVNTAKQLLYAFASEQKDKVHLTYLIGGFLKNGIGGSVQIVHEEDVDKIKGKFKVVTSEHVYSIQKTKTSDLNILYTVDVDRSAGKEEDAKRLSSIKYNFSVLRPCEEVAGLKRITQSAARDTNEKKWPLANKPIVSSTNKGIEDKKQVEEGGNNKDVGKDSANKKDQKKGGIVAMFAAQSIKNKKQNDEEIKAKTVETKKPKSGSGISAFFSRQVDLPSRPKNDSGVSSQSDSQDSPKKMEIDSKNTADNDVEILKNNSIVDKNDESIKLTKDSNKKDIVSKPKGMKQKSDEKKRGRGKNKKASVDEDMPPAKKRKRIVIISDSEDSDDAVFGKEEEVEDEGVCYSPAPQPQQPDTDGDDDVIPPTPEASLRKGRKRIRKLIDKTYMGEDGYMLTRKEYIFESCTESEPEEEKEKENKSKDCSEQLRTEKLSPKIDVKEPLSKKKKVSPQNTKQASIRNFFKKK